jgi:hypothetical protein
MGIVLGRVVFDGDPPQLAAIVESLERVTGLAVDVDSCPHDPDGLYSFHARLAFACDPTLDIEVYAYEPGAVKKLCGEMLPAEAPWMTMTAMVQGARETADHRTVYTRGGQDITLMVAVDLALEALGGVPTSRVSPADEASFSVRITPEELARRRRKSRRDGYWMMAIVVPLTVLALPFSLLWSVLTLPWRLWRAYCFVKSPRSPVNRA